MSLWHAAVSCLPRGWNSPSNVLALSRTPRNGCVLRIACFSEAAILLVYGAGAMVYRIILFFSITLVVMGKLFAIGLLLAVVGQIYQTGADTESLFAGWALLALPWVSISCAPWLWLFWLLLVNTAMALFLVGRIDILMVFFYSDAMFWGPLLFNALALSVWEFLWPRVDWMRVTYAPRFIVFLAAIAATGLGASWWFLTRRVEWQLIHFAPIGYLIWLSVTIWHYGKRRQDIVPLALSALSCIAVLTAGLISTLFGSRHFDVVSFFVIGVAVATMTAAAAAWLRLTSSRWSKIREVRGA